MGHRQARSRRGDEDASAGTGPRLDQAPGLEQAHGLVDRRHRDAEAPPQILLGAQPIPGLELVGDLALELPGDELRPRHARPQR